LAPALEPWTAEVWKERLPAALVELGMAFTADGVEHSHLVATPTELQFATPKEFLLGMKEADLNKAVQRLIGRPMKIKIAAGLQAVALPAAQTPEDDLTRRALSHPEVRRFQELFGGQVRTVRNLKE
ncbi:MAG: DNA polymerase III subunit gamma/tau, partial [Acidobacteria bacterium]|nr:DNA polymerase III subunit gamma/tau [Acidobacteriota bacterium]